MSAVEWAKDVLALPSTSKGSVDVKNVSVSIEELAVSWCEVLRSEETSEEDKKLILRALRVSKLPQSHDVILHDLSPLLANSSPSIRLQTAGALLQYSNLASSAILSTHIAPIATAVTRCLASLRITIHSTSSPSSASRLVATCFRILNTLVSKISPLSNDVIDILAPLLGHWVYHGPSNSGTASPAPAPARARYNDNSQLPFGVMSSFAQNSISPRKVRRAPSPARSSRSEMGETSESESEEGRKDRRADSAQIRMDALTCLRSLALNNPKALQKHWHYFLSDSPYLRNRLTLMTLVESDPSREVRIQACRALEAMLTDSTTYLAIAQDRPTKASFTSLSTKVGEIVGESHLALNAILSKPSPSDQADVRIAVLKLAARLASCSPYGRMKRSLAEPFAKAVLTNLDNQDPAVVVASVEALTAIAQRHTSTTSSSTLDHDLIVSTVENHAGHEASEELQIAAWTMIRSSVGALPDRDWTFVVSLFLNDFEDVSPAIQASRARFLAALFPSTSTVLPHDSCSTAMVTLHVPLLLRALLDSTDPSTRIIACSILPHPYLTSDRDCHPLVWAKELMNDEDRAVSQAASRALGSILRDSKVSNDEHKEAVAMLICDFLEDSDGDISWALANACDALTEKDARGIDFPVIVDRAIILLVTPSSDERIHISCVRILGSMLRLMSKVFEAHDGAFEEVLSILSEALDSPIAKIRWNACSSINSALPHLSPAVLETYTFQLLFDQLATILAQDPSYKVRIHSASLLAKAVELLQAGEQQTIDHRRFGPTAKEASLIMKREMEEGKISSKEKRHVEVLVQKLETLVELTSTADAAS